MSLALMIASASASRENNKENMLMDIAHNTIDSDLRFSEEPMPRQSVNSKRSICLLKQTATENKNVENASASVSASAAGSTATSTTATAPRFRSNSSKINQKSNAKNEWPVVVENNDGDVDVDVDIDIDIDVRDKSVIIDTKTVIIFDWDDTLFPACYLQAVNVYPKSNASNGIRRARGGQSQQKPAHGLVRGCCRKNKNKNKNIETENIGNIGRNIRNAADLSSSSRNNTKAVKMEKLISDSTPIIIPNIPMPTMTRPRPHQPQQTYEQSNQMSTNATPNINAHQPQRIATAAAAHDDDRAVLEDASAAPTTESGSSTDLELAIVNEMRCLEKVVYKLLNYAISLVGADSVFIITNAERGWVQLSADAFLPSILPILRSNKCQVVSARSSFEAKYPQSPLNWKRHAFKHALQKALDISSIYMPPRMPTMLMLMMIQTQTQTQTHGGPTPQTEHENTIKVNVNTGGRRALKCTKNTATTTAITTRNCSENSKNNKKNRRNSKASITSANASQSKDSGKENDSAATRTIQMLATDCDGNGNDNGNGKHDNGLSQSQSQSEINFVQLRNSNSSSLSANTNIDINHKTYKYNILSIGDSMVERQAVHDVGNCLIKQLEQKPQSQQPQHNHITTYIKSIKFLPTPDILELVQQLQMVQQNLKRIVRFGGHLDYKVKTSVRSSMRVPQK